MKKNIFCIALCMVLSAAFIVGGFLLLDARSEKQKSNEVTLQRLQDKKSQITTEELTKEGAELDQQNQQLEEQISAAEKQCAELDEQAQQLQQEYDALLQDETNIYYKAILDALTEGMNKVEEYINGSK